MKYKQSKEKNVFSNPSVESGGTRAKANSWQPSSDGN